MADNLEDRSRSGVNVVERLADYLFTEALDLKNRSRGGISFNGSIKTRAIRLLNCVPEPFKDIYSEPFYSSIESVLNSLYSNTYKCDTYKKLLASYNYIRKYAEKKTFEPAAKKR